MTTDLFTAEEITTRKLFAKVDNTQDNILIGGVFKGMYYAALSVDRIQNIASAMHGLQGCDLQEALTKLCRQKILRSRMNQGKRLYEVNY